MTEDANHNREARPEGGAGDGRAEKHGEGLIKPPKPSFMANLRSSFFAGIVVVAPIGITAAIVYWFLTGPLTKLDAFVKQALPENGGNIDTILHAIPFLGVIVAIILIVILGAFAKNFVGRAFIRAGEELLDSVPVIRSLYRFFKNVFETALQQSERSFKEVALVEYPRPGAWAICFVVGDTKGEIVYRLADQGEQLTSVFVPTVPNPTSGFLLFVPRATLRPLTMSVEDAAKAVFSIGLVTPPFDSPDDAVKKLEEMAAEAAEPKKHGFRLPIPGRRKAGQDG
ncbi:MAG: DUF502 domain-containing protein [Alphaproteobacteria bacterium]|nr:DUF502 domain-containing protein [Alphaproteobacteria bacterium]